MDKYIKNFYNYLIPNQDHTIKNDPNFYNNIFRKHEEPKREITYTDVIKTIPEDYVNERIPVEKWNKNINTEWGWIFYKNSEDADKNKYRAMIYSSTRDDIKLGIKNYCDKNGNFIKGYISDEDIKEYMGSDFTAAEKYYYYE